MLLIAGTAVRQGRNPGSLHGFAPSGRSTEPNMVRRAKVETVVPTRHSDLVRSEGSHDEGSGVPTPRVPVLAFTRHGQDAYAQQLQRDLSDFAHPGFANEITPVVDVRDLFGSEEEFEAVFPDGWGQAPLRDDDSEEVSSPDDALPELPRGSRGVPEVDLEELLDAAESRRQADLGAPWMRPASNTPGELVVRGALSVDAEREVAAAEPKPLPGTGSMWPTIRPPPLSAADREVGAARLPPRSPKPPSQSTAAGWRASHGPLAPPSSVLPRGCVDDEDAPPPLLLTRVRSSPAPSPSLARDDSGSRPGREGAAPSGSSIAPVYYTDAPPPVPRDVASDRSAWTGLFRTAPAWAPPLVSALAAAALTVVVLGWSSGRTVPAEPPTISDPISAESLLAAAASPSSGAGSVESAGAHPGFDRPAADAALRRAAVQAATCVGLDAPRTIDIRLTFGPEGTVSRALILDSRLLGTPQGVCIVSAFQGARIPPFPEPAITFERSVQLQPAQSAPARSAASQTTP